MLSIKRLIHPNPLKNEKNVTYNYMQQDDYDTNLLLDLISDGVFGIEAVKTSKSECYQAFTPIHFKLNLNTTDRHELFDTLYNTEPNDISIAHFYLDKTSMFPLEMKSDYTMWNIINSIAPYSSVNIIYQLLLSYRQDNWKDQLTDQYECYQNGIENPSESSLFRRLQKSVTETIDNLLKWEYNHARISEVETKISQKGYRYNLRIIVTEGNKKQRELILNKIKAELNKHSYLNNWTYTTFKADRESIDEVVERKFNSIAKYDVLCFDELIPFVSNKKQAQSIQQPLLTKSDTQQIATVTTPNAAPDNVQTEQVAQSEIASYNPNDVFKLLPKGKELADIEYEATASNFVKALREIKSFKPQEMKVIGSKAGASIMKITFRIPKSLKFSEIVKTSTISDVQIKMGIKSLQIKQGENNEEIDVTIPLQSRRKVFLRNYIDTPEFRNFIKNNPLPILVGVNETGEPIYNCITKIVHLLVAGTTGSGKSVWLNQVILTMLMIKSPSELQMYMIDMKQVELTQFKDFPHVQSIITDAHEAIRLLDKLKVEVDRRYKLFKENGVNNIKLYNKKSHEKLPFIVCIIDEYAELVIRNKDVHLYIQSLAQLARACGVHLIIATQRPSVDVITGIIKANLPSKIAFRCADSTSYRTILNTRPRFDLLGNGDGVMSFEGQSEEHIRFQGCLIIDDKNDEGLESKLIKQVANFIENNNVYIEDEEVEEESDLDKLKRLIVNTNETRVDQLQKKLRINRNKLNDMMQQLVDEGFLEQGATRSQGRRLAASEEEIRKYKD